MAGRILHVLSQRPSRTGSGVTLEAVVEHAARRGWTQAAAVGVPVDDPRPRVGGLPAGSVHPLTFAPDDPGCRAVPDVDFPVPGMSDVMPYRSSVWSTLDQGAIRFENSTNSMVWADIQVEGRRLRVYSVHLQSNHISGDAAKLREKGDLQERETWVGIKGILRKYKRATQLRAEQAEQVAAHIAQSPYPVIVCGDFNDTPVSYAYHHILQSRRLADAFRKSGSGPGFTYGGVLPALRIDFILTDPELDLRNHDRYRESFSDHFPVLCEIDLP